MKKLERSLSLTSVIAISIGGMLGSGIFVLPGLAAAKTGSSVWLAYLLAAVCILPAAFSKSELATAMPSSGGTYVYIERAFGPLFGTIAGIGLWLSLLFKSAFALVGFGAYLSILINIDAGLTKYVAVTFLALILFLNILGVKKVGKVQIFIVSISLISLALILLFGIPRTSAELLDPFMIKGKMGLFSTVAFVYISYAGVTKVAAIAGEIKNPGTNLPLAMILSLFIMTIIYVSVAFVLVGNLPLDELKTDIKPIYTIAKLLGGNNVGYIASVVGIITLISMANSGVLAASRFPFAMAIDKLLPDFMGKIHAKYLTPVVTIVMTCFLMAMVIIFLDVEKIAKLASAFMVMMFILVNACVIVLRETSAQWYKPEYRSPLYPFVQLFGIFSGIALLIFLGSGPMLAIVGILILGLVIYYFFGRNATRTGILRKYGHRPALYLLYKRKRNAKITYRNNGTGSLQNLDGKLASDAGVVVPLLGNERSPEMLVEIGAAINKNEKIQVVNVTEVPNQTFLDAMVEENPRIASLERRVSRLAVSQGIDLDFEAAVTHEISDTIHELSNQTHCDWLVMGWNGRAHSGILVSNPIGWLLTHINSDFALFKDDGVRYIGKVLLALRPGRKDKNFIAVADRICNYYRASLTLLHVVPSKTDDETIDAMETKSKKLLEKVDTPSMVIVQKEDDSIGAISRASASFDLLILGTPQKDNWVDILFGTGKDKFTEKSACSVLRLTMRDH
ncbi:amino acid permease [Flagellimonas sp. HMM57]|uniref:amino acid permease n=1 Tax=unclassified Flagellimonas TaxID=2644544 RepID=UPI0013D2271F|nr:MULTISPECIES: amino acid permease [unclassified Flagellimonas]UII77678.1 amino acid permease [Flagellimonas sp. HMM57]